VFLHWLEIDCFPQSWCSSPMKTLTVGQRSFQMLTHFTMLNKVQDPLFCNINASLTRFAVLLPFTWNRWFCTKVMLFIQETLRGTQYSFKEQTEFTILTKLLDPLFSNIKDSLTKTAVFLPFTWKWLFCTKVMFLTHGNTERKGLFP
jgi:hypothetical protein